MTSKAPTGRLTGAVLAAAMAAVPASASAQSIVVAHADEWSVAGYDVDSVRSDGHLRHVTTFDLSTNRARTVFRYSITPHTLDCRSRTTVIPPGSWLHVLDDPAASVRSDLDLRAQWGPDALMEFEGVEAVAYLVCLDEAPEGRRWNSAEALARHIRDRWPAWSDSGPTPRQQYEARLAARFGGSGLSAGLKDKLGAGLTEALGPVLR